MSCFLFSLHASQRSICVLYHLFSFSAAGFKSEHAFLLCYKQENYHGDAPANNLVLIGSFMVREDSEVQGVFTTIILDQVPGVF